MDGEPTLPAGSRRARMALLIAGAVVLLAAAVGVGAARGAAGKRDSQPGGAAEVAAAGATVGGQGTGATVAGGGSGGRLASGGGSGGGGTSPTTASRPTTTSSPPTTRAPTTTTPMVVIIGGNPQRSIAECTQQADGRWHFRVEFRFLVLARGVGTVRYQWGRGGGDVRSDVRAYVVDEKLAENTIYTATDSIVGSSDSSTDTVIDRFHVLEPAYLRPDGSPVVGTITAKICP